MKIYIDNRKILQDSDYWSLNSKPYLVLLITYKCHDTSNLKLDVSKYYTPYTRAHQRNKTKRDKFAQFVTYIKVKKVKKG